MSAINVRVKRLNAETSLPSYKTVGASGMDVCAAKDVLIGPGETVVVPTGLAFEIPLDYEIQVRPRSGLSSKTKLRLANAPGTVDSDYRGELGVIIDNIAFPGPAVNYVTTLDGYVRYLDDPDATPKWALGTYLIRKGDRIAQLVLGRVERMELTLVDALDVTERGDGGFGHTGVN